MKIDKVRGRSKDIIEENKWEGDERREWKIVERKWGGGARGAKGWGAAELRGSGGEGRLSWSEGRRRGEEEGRCEMLKKLTIDGV